jgi:hypothetical protein
MALDTFTLNGTSLNDSANYALEAVDFTPPAKKPEWAESADSDGANLIRTPLFENRTITATIRIAEQGSMDAVLAKFGELVDLLQEAEKNPGGIPLKWSPANSTKTITFYVLTGMVTEIPMVNEGETAGWYAEPPTPQVKISLTCKPFGYGAQVEIAAAAMLTPQPNLTLEVQAVAGDVPAEGLLVVTDEAGKGRRFVEWGLENRYYNPSTALLLDSEDMTPVGGAQAALGHAYQREGATHGTIATTLLPEPTICCNTGNLSHVGTFRVKARIEVVLGTGGFAENIHLRLAWQDGEGPLRANTWQTPLLGGLFVEADLGTITISPTIAGTQKWFGQIEAYGNNAAAVDVLHIDYLTFIPVAEGYGKARGVQSSAPGTIAAFDDFTTGTLSGSLNTRTPAVGTAWSTSGATTDFTVEASHAKRATTSDAGPRYGLVGSALGNSRATLACWATTLLGVESGEYVTSGVLLRWVNASNYAFCRVRREFRNPVRRYHIEIGVNVAGETTILASTEQLVAIGTGGGEIAFTATCTATADGLLAANGYLTGSSGVNLPAFALSASHTALMTGGPIASGKAGLLDESTPASVSTRRYTELTVSTLPSPPYCIEPSRSLEFRSDSAISADSTGAFFGPVPEYRGSRFYVPQGGSANRPSRIIVKADRNDLEESDQQILGDAFGVQVFITPRYHAIPR